MLAIVLGLLLTTAGPSGESPGVLRIYLARHGETNWNAEHRLQGSADIPLNDTGRHQAAILSERLQGEHLDAVYASTLRRSRDTAELVHGAAPVHALPGLGERRLGAFEGRRTDDSDPVSARQYARRSQEPDDTLDGGESLNQFFSRVRATITDIRTQYPAGTILIVGHGGTNQMIVRTLLNWSADQTRAFVQGNDDLYVIEVAGDRPAHLWKFVAAAHP